MKNSHVHKKLPVSICYKGSKLSKISLTLYLLSIDEGISGYRDHSLEEVKYHSETSGLQLKILSYKQLYNWSMDEIVSVAGRKSNCTFCGVFRRQV